MRGRLELYRAVDRIQGHRPPGRGGTQPDATYVVFYGSDGYSTGLPLDYLRNQQVLMAYGINNVTLPAARGFPFQLVAVNKYGYKWAKWITSIDVVNSTVEGYWESRGYSNSANVSTPSK